MKSKIKDAKSGFKNSGDSLREAVDKVLFPNTVNHPTHYGGDTQFEVIKVLEHWLTREEFVGAMKFQIFKYTQRAGKKETKQEINDHKKSIWYQTYLADFIERNP